MIRIKQQHIKALLFLAVIALLTIYTFNTSNNNAYDSKASKVDKDLKDILDDQRLYSNAANSKLGEAFFIVLPSDNGSENCCYNVYVAVRKLASQRGSQPFKLRQPILLDIILPDTVVLQLVDESTGFIKPIDVRHISDDNIANFNLYKTFDCVSAGPRKATLFGHIEHRNWTWNALPQDVPFESIELKSVSLKSCKTSESPMEYEKLPCKGTDIGCLQALSAYTTVDVSTKHLSDMCGLKYFTYSNVSQCLKQKTVHWIGDSNSRRALKSFYGSRLDGGWCDSRPQDIICLCEDNRAEPELPDPIVTDNGLRIDFMFCTGTSPQPWSPQYEYANVAQHVSQLPSPDVVVFALLAYDVAFETLDHFEEHMQKLVQMFTISYENVPVIVYRTPNYYCCGWDLSLVRSYTLQRFVLYNAIARQLFRQAFGSRLVVWDVFEIGRYRATESVNKQVTQCKSAHETSEYVSFENQALWNMLCRNQQSI